jgi:hypothetical protein
MCEREVFFALLTTHDEESKFKNGSENIGTNGEHQQPNKAH